MNTTKYKDFKCHSCFLLVDMDINFQFTMSYTQSIFDYWQFILNKLLIISFYRFY